MGEINFFRGKYYQMLIDPDVIDVEFDKGITISILK
jgi:hypothetical protein